jgi:hypothetical protein
MLPRFNFNSLENIYGIYPTTGVAGRGSYGESRPLSLPESKTFQNSSSDFYISYKKPEWRLGEFWKNLPIW